MDIALRPSPARKRIRPPKQRHPIYQAWLGMRRRCSDPSHETWRYYGGRGISFAPEWAEFKTFNRDMGATWKPGLSLDRIDNNRGYGPENCRWATHSEQMSNTRRTRFIETPWGRLTMAQTARRVGVALETMRRRLDLGLPLDALLSPPDPYHPLVGRRAK